MTSKQPFRFHTLPQLCVAGGTAAGELELDIPLLLAKGMEEILVKLRGSVHTEIRGKSGTMQETSQLVQLSISLWKRGTAHTASEPHTTRIPFEFALPSTLPPSFDFMGMDTKAVIRYFIELVGVRPGTFRMNKKCIFPLAVVPSDPHGAELHSALQFGWDGPWTTVRREGQVRKALWGEYAKAEVELTLPTIDQFPLFTPIPYSMKVITFSKTMRRTDACRDKAIFPAPPLHPREIEFFLRRSTNICAQAWEVSSGERVHCLGSMCDRNSAVHVSNAEKVWIALSDDPEKGMWKQEATFSHAIELKCSPTFRMDTITNEYSLHAEVSFGGLSNKVAINIPIVIISSMASSADLDFEAPPLPSPEYSRRIDRFRSRPLNRTAQAWSSQANTASFSHSFSAHLTRHASMPPPSYPREPSQSSSSGTSGARSPALDLPPSYWSSNPSTWDCQSAASQS
ncbi:hypothetical protein B0H21DRAFT_566041 [Amylocystis lapponica]|nr:hypothetical protein B0H21DRAFT_566041 [Amylocystis lapponica]